MHPQTQKLLRRCAAAAVGLACTIAHGKDPTYPARPVSLVVPYIEGSQPDVVARVLAKEIPRFLPGSGLEVVNRVGDSGVAATADVLQAPSDGYTLLLGRVATHAIAPAQRPDVSYRWNDFTMLGLLEIEPLICMVSGASPYRTLRELLDAARKTPGSLKFGHTGESTILYLVVRYLLKLDGLPPSSMKGVDLARVPRSIPDNLVAGEVDFACTGVSAHVLEAIKTERVRALFSTTPGRHPQLPQLKNAREVGFPDLSNMVGWSALMGPPRMPAHVVQQWKRALGRLAKDPDWNARLLDLGALQTLGTLKDNERFLQQQHQMYGRIVDSIEKGQ